MRRFNRCVFPGVIAIIVAGIMAFDGCADKGSNPTSVDQSTSPPVSDPVQTQDVSFRSNILPIFQRYGCAGCHGGNGGLFVQTVAQLLQGGLHGPAIVPGKPDASNLALKISAAPPFGDRMPQGGPYLPDSTIQTIRLWITQGAKNN
jgi:hypothetical protein